CFSVVVPISTAPLSREPQRKLIGVDRSQLDDMTVLCIDDEPRILDGMEVLLAGWGCRILKAPNLVTALAAISESQIPPSGLLVDYHLGGDNGIAAIAELRRQFGSDLPAILITADRNPDVHAMARRHNIQVLHKPIKPASLRALLAQ